MIHARNIAHSLHLMFHFLNQWTTFTHKKPKIALKHPQDLGRTGFEIERIRTPEAKSDSGWLRLEIVIKHCWFTLFITAVANQYLVNAMERGKNSQKIAESLFWSESYDCSIGKQSIEMSTLEMVPFGDFILTLVLSLNKLAHWLYSGKSSIEYNTYGVCTSNIWGVNIDKYSIWRVTLANSSKNRCLYCLRFFAWHLLLKLHASCYFVTRQMGSIEQAWWYYIFAATFSFVWQFAEPLKHLWKAFQGSGLAAYIYSLYKYPQGWLQMLWKAFKGHTNHGYPSRRVWPGEALNGSSWYTACRSAYTLRVCIRMNTTSIKPCLT